MRKEVDEPWILLGELYSGGHSNDESREDLIKNAKETLWTYIWNRMRRYGEIRPPFIENPQSSDFVKSQGVQEIITSDIKGYGYLLRKNDHFIIVIKKGLQETKKRSVIAHELGHTFFFDSNNKHIYFYENICSRNCWRFIEGPAFEIGRQILVPKQSLSEWVSSNISIEFFNELKRKYKVSKNIMAFRLIHDLRLWNVYMFFTKYDSTKDEIMLPRIHERFKGISFKNFDLNKNWREVRACMHAEALKESTIVPKGLYSKKKKIGRYYYHIQSYSKTGTYITCLIKRARSWVYKKRNTR